MVSFVVDGVSPVRSHSVYYYVQNDGRVYSQSCHPEQSSLAMAPATQYLTGLPTLRSQSSSISCTGI